METAIPILLGTAVQHALESTNPVHAHGVADRPSRNVGTHQRTKPATTSALTTRPELVHGSTARAACSAGLEPVLSKRPDDRSAAGGGVGAAARAATALDETRNYGLEPKAFVPWPGGAESALCWLRRGGRYCCSLPAKHEHRALASTLSSLVQSRHFTVDEVASNNCCKYVSGAVSETA